MKNLNLPLNKHLFNLFILLTISFSVACKKDSTGPLSPKNKIVYFGGQDKNLYALNGNDGALIWKYQSGGDFSYSTPALVNGTIYSTNTDHNLYAIDAASGTLKWKFASESSIISSPAVVNGIAYFGSDDHFIYAIDAISGSLKWKYQTQQNVDSSPNVSNGVVYIGSADGNLYALDAATGSLKWKYNTGSLIVKSSALISNGVAFIGNRNGDLSAINASNGQLKWKISTDGISLEQSTPIINNGVIYFASWYNTNDFQQRGSLYAIKETDGTLIWKGLKEQGFTSGPVYAEGKVFINSDDLNMYAVDALTGNEIWKKPIIANGALPTAANGKIFAGGGGSNFFYVLDAESGNESWKFPLTNCITTSKPLVVTENYYQEQNL
jgi:outer membrane protein assembly factor BamB